MLCSLRSCIVCMNPSSSMDDSASSVASDVAGASAEHSEADVCQEASSGTALNDSVNSEKQSSVSPSHCTDPVMLSNVTLESRWMTFQSQVAKTFDHWFSSSPQKSTLTTASASPPDAAAKVPTMAQVERAVDPLGFSFSPAGLLLPYHLGVADCLEYFGMLTPSTPLAGASAGALAVACSACGVSAWHALRVLLRVENLIRQTGAARQLHTVLASELDNLLPPDVHTRLNTRPGRVTIAYTHVWPFFKGQFVSHFHSCSDVKECLVASCNIPFYFSNWPTVTCRGQPSVDGYFASTRTFGCPKTGAKRDICVLPFSAKTVRIAVHENDCISPDLQQYDLVLLKENGFARVYHEYVASRPTSQLHSSSSAAEIDSDSSWKTDDKRFEANDAAVQKLAEMWGIKNLNAPPAGVGSSASRHRLADVQKVTELPTLQYSIRTLLKVALDAAPDDVLLHLFDVGRADAYRWLSLETFRARGHQILV